MIKVTHATKSVVYDESDPFMVHADVTVTEPETNDIIVKVKIPMNTSIIDQLMWTMERIASEFM